MGSDLGSKLQGLLAVLKGLFKVFVRHGRVAQLKEHGAGKLGAEPAVLEATLLKAAGIKGAHT